MDFKTLEQQFSANSLMMKQAIFASFFIQQNKLQTACDKLDEEITMKQWLLLAMAGTSKEPLTLTQLGKLMGCSRQNVKKLALALEKKKFLKLQKNEKDNRATCLLFDEKMDEYAMKVGSMQMDVLKLLFENFSEEEIQQYFNCTMKLYDGIEKVEEYVTHLNT